jgi:hypothetical protein
LLLLCAPGNAASYSSALSAILEPLPDVKHSFLALTPSGESVVIKLQEPDGREQEEFVKDRGEGLFAVSVEKEARQPQQASRYGGLELV